jgi:Kef-type K+ transport system membrane component KefB
MTHGLDTEALAAVAACVVLWSVLSARLGRIYISAPIAFLVMGLLVTHGPLAILHFSPHSATIRSLAEVTLALVLFTDASRVNVHELVLTRLHAHPIVGSCPRKGVPVGSPIEISRGVPT